MFFLRNCSILATLLVCAAAVSVLGSRTNEYSNVVAPRAAASLSPQAQSAVDNILSQLQYPQPTTIPQSNEEVFDYLKRRYQFQNNTGYVGNALDYVLNGLLSSNDSSRQGFQGALLNESPQGINSYANDNPPPPDAIYPQKQPSDPAYSVSEDDLRSAVFIPDTFDANNSPNPVLLVHGTGAFGGISFEGNFIKVLQNDSSIGQPVWLNIPTSALQNAQLNAEYIAYGINYVSSITGQRVNVIGASQANLDTQWALKYFPSTRNSTTQLICVSPAFHGTLVANIMDLGTDAGIYPQAQAVLQQEYAANYVLRARQNDGDSAYVPTMTFYSLTDQAVVPQQNPIASAIINDARGVGVSNNQVQEFCGIAPAGGVQTHESLLYNNFVISMAIEALRRRRPVQANEIDLAAACGTNPFPGLNLGDVLETESIIVVASINMLEYIAAGNGSYEEPPLMPYATY